MEIMPEIIQQAFDVHHNGRLAEAEKLYLSVASEDPNYFQARYRLGMVYDAQDRLAEALQEFIKITKARPDFAEVWLALSKCAQRLGQNDLSLEASIKSTLLMPQQAQAWLRNGFALSCLGRDSGAIQSYHRATELDPQSTSAWINLGLTLKKIGKPLDAECAIEKAMKFSGATFATEDDAEEYYGLLQWHLALIKLGLGKYRDGFAYFRARFKGGTSWKRLHTKHPLWRQQELRNKTILITAEQGHGDLLMMARYLPLIKKQGAKIIFQTHPALTRYFMGWEAVEDIISTDKPVPAHFDYYAPIFDLPYIFRTEMQTIPAQSPYLPILQSDEKTALIPCDGRKIGVLWAGEPLNPRDKLRSLPLEHFVDIFAAPGNCFFSLAHKVSDQDLALLKQYNVQNLADRIDDFADLARITSQLDLIITCDTAIAHLAGGMGKTVWIILPHDPDWRWGYESSHSTWHPSAQLFRQSRPQDWADVMENVKKALQALRPQ